MKPPLSSIGLSAAADVIARGYHDRERERGKKKTINTFSSAHELRLIQIPVQFERWNAVVAL